MIQSREMAEDCMTHVLQPVVKIAFLRKTRQGELQIDCHYRGDDPHDEETQRMTDREFDIIGGKMEPQDKGDEKRALLREIKEECGIECDTTYPTGEQKTRYRIHTGTNRTWGNSPSDWNRPYECIDEYRPTRSITDYDI